VILAALATAAGLAATPPSPTPSTGRAEAESHDRSGVALGDAGQTAAALAEFREAVRLDPRLPAARFHLGLALERMGQPRAAIAEYQQALGLEPEMIEARYGLASACAAVGDLDGAILLLRRIVQKAPGFAEARYNLGVDLWNRYRSGRGPRNKADLDEAASELEAARRLDPSQPKIHFALGELQAERQSLALAVASLERAVALSPGNPQYPYNLGLALRLQGDLDAAETRLRRAIELDPKHALARRALGLLLRQKSELAGAATELRLSAAELPEDPQGHHLLGGVLLKLDDLPAAIEELRAATRLDPRLTEARVLLAQALLKAGRKDEAQAEQAEVQRINAEKGGLGSAMLLMESAAAQIKKGQRVAGIAQLREAARLSPDFPEAHYQLGLALRGSAADASETEAAFLRVLKLDPGHAQARYELGRLLLGRGDAASAAFQFDKAIEAAPSLLDARRERARIAAQSHDWDAAAAELRALLAWDPGDAKAHRNLATALDGRGEGEDAARERATARRLETARKAPVGPRR
jgi:tetratricopeptide (TPR) repeat protein